MKCLACKLQNATTELKIHPNAQTHYIVKHLLSRLEKRQYKKNEHLCSLHTGDIGSVIHEAIGILHPPKPPKKVKQPQTEVVNG